MSAAGSTVARAPAARLTRGPQAPGRRRTSVGFAGDRPLPGAPPACARADRRRSTTRSYGSLPTLIGVALWGCAHTTHTVPPYRNDGLAAEELVDRARSSCLERTSQLPPRPFVTDGCSAFADAGWVECCVEHDAVYWCGGTAEGRRRADRRLEQCVAELGHPFLARLMYLGVRAGGPAWIPVPWRWGFGWDFPDDGSQRDGPATRRNAADASAAEPPK
jgi:hypothetical protein